MHGKDCANPVLVEIWRGQQIESWHRGAFIIVDAAGRMISSAGETAMPIFPRSAIKILQAIPLAASGAAQAYALQNAELALACASHGGEPVHVAAARRMLAKAGLDQTALGCGAHWPLNGPAARALAAAGELPAAIHHNCSGKHAGMLLAALRRGWPLGNYLSRGHPLQEWIKDTLAAYCSVELNDASFAIDGCSAPNWAMPLQALALGFARLPQPGEGRQPGAVRLLMDACFAEPHMVAGHGRLCTQLMQQCGKEIFVKAGAEGVFAAALPRLGLGLAVKIDDGGRRAAEKTLLTTLASLFPDRKPQLEGLSQSTLRNHAGIEVGRVKAAQGLLDALAQG